MLAAQQGLPNGLAILANSVFLLGALWGFYKVVIRALHQLVKDEVMPLVAQHVADNEAQAAATNKVLKKLQKSFKAHERRDDASFRAVNDALARIEANGHASERS